METSRASGALIEDILKADADAVKQDVGKSSELAAAAKEWTKPEPPPAQNQAGQRADGQVRFDRD